MAHKGEKKWTYFYYSGKLYHTLSVARALDELYAERVTTKEPRFFSYSDVVRNAERCWSISQVSRATGVPVYLIQRYYREGYLLAPEFAKNGRNNHKRMLTEKHIADLIKFSNENRRGQRGRKRVAISKTLGEVMLELKEGIVLYTKTKNGFVPVWRAEEW